MRVTVTETNTDEFVYSGPLSEFLGCNDFEPDLVAELHEALGARRRYVIGGGAGVAFTIKRA